MFFIAYTFKGQVHVFAVRVKIVSHSSCRTSAIFKYFCPLIGIDKDFSCEIVIFLPINLNAFLVLKRTVIENKETQTLGPEVIKKLCSTQLSMRLIMLINAKMQSIAGILTFISRINTTSESLKEKYLFSPFYLFMSDWNFTLSWLEHERKKSFINWRPVLFYLCNQLGENCSQNFHLGRYIIGYTVGN